MASYPFQTNLQIWGGTSRKLKIIAVAGGVPITRIIEQIVDYVYERIPEEKLVEAKEKLGVKD